MKKIFDEYDVKEMLKKIRKDEQRKSTCIFSIIGIMLAIAGIAAIVFVVMKKMHCCQDDLDFDDDYDDDYDTDGNECGEGCASCSE